MAARFDKYDGMVGGFRAKLAAAITDPAQIGVPLGIGLDANGLAVVGAGTTGVVGVTVFDQAKAVGDVADVMTSGEIVDLDEDDFNPGTVYYAGTDGALSTTNTGARVGATAGDKSLTTGEVVSRLVVRFVPLAAA